MRHLSGRAALALSILAAIVYNSWPLGYALNPTVAKHDLASSLSAAGQPYNWVFTGGDILTGVILLILAVDLWRKFGRKPAATVAVIGYALFGVLTAASALLPLGCSATDPHCGSYAAQVFGPHDITGAVASVGLFVSLIAVWVMGVKQGVARQFLRPLQLVTVLWGVSGIVYIPLTLLSNEAVLTQQIFLILSGAGLIVIANLLNRLTRHSSPA